MKRKWDKEEFPEGSYIVFRSDSHWSERYTLGIIDSTTNSIGPDQTEFVPVRILRYTEYCKKKYPETVGCTHGGFWEEDLLVISDADAQKILNPELEKVIEI